MLHHDLHAALRDLRQADERRVPLLPVRVDGPLRQQRYGDGHHRRAAQRQRDAVQAFLPELVQFALAIRLVRVRLRLMPLRFILQRKVPAVAARGRMPRSGNAQSAGL